MLYQPFQLDKAASPRRREGQPASWHYDRDRLSASQIRVFRGGLLPARSLEEPPTGRTRRTSRPLNVTTGSTHIASETRAPGLSSLGAAIITVKLSGCCSPNSVLAFCRK